MITRRELLACLMAGGCVTAAGLWWPGEKLISIPKKQGWDLILANGDTLNIEIATTHMLDGSVKWKCMDASVNIAGVKKGPKIVMLDDPKFVGQPYGPYHLKKNDTLTISGLPDNV